MWCRRWFRTCSCNGTRRTRAPRPQVAQASRLLDFMMWRRRPAAGFDRSAAGRRSHFGGGGTPALLCSHQSARVGCDSGRTSQRELIMLRRIANVLSIPVIWLMMPVKLLAFRFRHRFVGRVLLEMTCFGDFMLVLAN